MARWHIHRDQRGKVCQRAGIGHTPEGQSTRITGLGFMTRQSHRNLESRKAGRFFLEQKLIQRFWTVSWPRKIWYLDIFFWVILSTKLRWGSWKMCHLRRCVFYWTSDFHRGQQWKSWNKLSPAVNHLIRDWSSTYYYLHFTLQLSRRWRKNLLFSYYLARKQGRKPWVPFKLSRILFPRLPKHCGKSLCHLLPMSKTLASWSCI